MLFLKGEFMPKWNFSPFLLTLMLLDRRFSALVRGPGWSAGCPTMVSHWTWPRSPGSTTSSWSFFPAIWSTGWQRDRWTKNTTTDCTACGPDTGDIIWPGFLSVLLCLMIPGHNQHSYTIFISLFVSFILLRDFSLKPQFIFYNHLDYSCSIVICKWLVWCWVINTVNCPPCLQYNGLSPCRLLLFMPLTKALAAERVPH